MPSALRIAAALTLTSAFAGPALAQPSATVISVQLSEYKFSPREIDLKAGEPYVLHLNNSGGKGHDLSAKAFFSTVSLAPGATAKVRDGKVDLDEGETADIAFVPHTPGTYEMHCGHFMHSMLGMQGKIVVR
jgi:plastocyanin